MQRITKFIETSNLCGYGCGQQAKYVNGSGKLMCCDRHTKCPALKSKNSQGLKQSYKDGLRISGKDLYQNLDQSVKDRMNWSKGKQLTPNEKLFKQDSSASNELLRKRISQDHLLEYQCSTCGLDEWRGKFLGLDLDHINGDNRDNRLENLRFLCPNCHSQTDTYKGKNINKGKTKVDDETLLTALRNNVSIRKALIEVGLTPKGGNYERAKKLVKKLNMAC